VTDAVPPIATPTLAAWPLLRAKGIDTKHADLRHANGFALKKT